MKQKNWIFLWLLCLPCFGKTELFRTPESLRPNAKLWFDVYSLYHSHEVIYFDENDPTLIYAIQTLPEIKNEISSIKYKDKVKKKFKEIQDILDDCAENRTPKVMTDEYEHIHKLLKKRNLLGKGELVNGLRYQNGLKEQFALGLKLSGRYMEEIKAILKSQNLPADLAMLVFVESLFYLSAVSYAGAAGLWGIGEETGRLAGIHINKFADERRDPVLSTWAAAQYINKVKKGLKEWELVITAYNYGYSGMLRAVESWGSSLENIIKNHKSGIFGFACKNYYSEFLAAKKVYENYQELFPDVVIDKAWRYDLVQLPKAVEVADLIKSKAISHDELSSLNPSLSKRTLQSEEVLPALYSLRVPHGKAKHFKDRLKKIASARYRAAEQKVSSKYKNEGRDNIITIARKLGINKDLLAARLKQPFKYRPTNLIIRSHMHLFSQLQDLKKHVVASIVPGEMSVSSDEQELSP